MAKQKKYWTPDEILKTKPTYAMVLGEKGNGKSYAVKMHVLKQFFEKGEKFALFRTFKEDLKNLSEYFEDMHLDEKGNRRIHELSGGEWDRIKVYRQEIYLVRDEEVTKKRIVDYDDNGKPVYDFYTDTVEVTGPQCGRAFWVSLSGYNNTASRAFVGYRWGIFEEFLTEYWQEENITTTFQKMVSTIYRDNDATIFMLGNRVTRINPFFKDWGLEAALNQKPGTIDTYDIEEYDEGTDRNYTVRISVESCPLAGSASSMIFGTVKKSINGNHYDVKQNAAILYSYNEKFVCVYELLVEYTGLTYDMKLLNHKETGAQVVRVSPWKGSHKVLRKISNKFSIDPLTTSSFNAKIKAEVKIQELIACGKICYSDALTANEFPQVLENIGV